MKAFYPISSSNNASDFELVSTSWALTQAADVTPRCRFVGEPVRWVKVKANMTLTPFAHCAVRTYTGSRPSDAFSTTDIGIVELTPLPSITGVAPVLKKLTAGLPVMYVLVESSVPLPTAEFLRGTDTLFNAVMPVWFGVCFQDRIVRDPAGWGALISAAIASLDPADRTDWESFVSSVLEPICKVGVGQRAPIYLVDHVGRPLNVESGEGHQLSVTFSDGSSASGKSIVDGIIQKDAGGPIDLLRGKQATVSYTFPSSGVSLLAGGEAKGGAFNNQPYPLALNERLLQVFNADRWFAARDPSILGLERWRPNSYIEPLVDGVAYFDRLVADIRAIGTGGGVHLAGWETELGFALLKADASSDLVSLLKAVRARNGQFRVLLNTFLNTAPGKEIKLDEQLAIIFFALTALGFAFQKVVTTDFQSLMILSHVLVTIFIISQVKPELILDLIKKLVEKANGVKTELDELVKDLGQEWAVLSPYPAKVGDNPFVKEWPMKLIYNLLSVNFVEQFGVYHMKFAVLDRGPSGPAADRYTSYLGGVDVHSNRLDTPLHRIASPFHDVQVRVSGPAMIDVAKTFEQRITHDRGTVAFTTPPLNDVTAFGAPGGPGPHLAQITRTYYRVSPTGGPNPPASPPTGVFTFAPKGERTTLDTLLKGIAAAQDYIYIEDQYFTPSDTFVKALLDAGESARGVRALVITVPTKSDQFYGNERRLAIFDALKTKWGARFSFGAPVRRYRSPTPRLLSNLGRVSLVNALTANATEMTLSPEGRLPEPPFWAFVRNELLFCSARSVGERFPQRKFDQAEVTFNIVRKQPPADGHWGVTPDAHPAGTPVMVVDVPGIYVHAKVMIVDDIFMAAGSTNLNRRGFFHDGELHAFAVPQHLKLDPTNPARLLRCQLWAEHMGLPPELGASLLSDPVSSLAYFKRSWFSGSRWQPLGGLTGAATALGTDFTPGDGIAGDILLAGFKASIQTLDKAKLWSQLIDPTSYSDTDVDIADTPEPADPKTDDRGPWYP